MATWLNWFACAEPDVVVRGVVLDGPDPTDAPVAGASVRLRDEGGTRHDIAKSKADGSFRIDAPRGSTIHLEIEGDDGLAASFLGNAGYFDVLRVPEGDVYAFASTELDAWKADFAGCPGVDASGAALVGDVRVYELVDPVTGAHPVVTSGHVDVFDAVGDAGATVCYLDDLGVYDPEAVVTGSTGRFAAFGLSSGLGEIEVVWEPATGLVEAVAYPVWLPDGGVAPRQPLFVSFPL